VFLEPLMNDRTAQFLAELYDGPSDYH